MDGLEKKYIYNMITFNFGRRKIGWRKIPT